MTEILPRVRDLSPQQIIDRAMAMIGRKDIRYSMIRGRNGGRDPYAADPRSRGYNSADCIGFAFWAFGIDRYQPDFPFYGGWINTDSMMMDAMAKRMFFVPLAEIEYPHMIVYPSGTKQEVAAGLPRIGHIGVAIDDKRVIHCSYSNDRLLGHGVDIGAPRIWTRHPRHMRVILNPLIKMPRAPAPLPRPPVPTKITRPKLKT